MKNFKVYKVTPDAYKFLRKYLLQNKDNNELCLVYFYSEFIEVHYEYIDYGISNLTKNLLFEDISEKELLFYFRLIEEVDTKYTKLCIKNLYNLLGETY